jgi:hypothetical protein
MLCRAVIVNTRYKLAARNPKQMRLAMFDICQFLPWVFVEIAFWSCHLPSDISCSRDKITACRLRSEFDSNYVYKPVYKPVLC